MEPQLSDELYYRFRDLLLSRSGLFYPEHKRDDLAHGLSLALKASGLKTLAELYSDAANNGASWDVMLSHLTIGETSFIRNKPQFEALRKHILPDIIQRRAALRSLRIWSAGCATGEEPYSIAMVLREILGNQEDSWHYSILATDLNPDFLMRAREALYSNWSFRDTADSLRETYFIPEGSRWRLKPEIRTMVTFSRLNLIEDNYPSITNGTTALDMILCRNVTIYFNEMTTRKVVERFYRSLSPGGWLIVGHSEPQASMYHQFEVHNFPNTVVYRKQLDAPMFAFDELPSFVSAPMPDLDALLRQLRGVSQSMDSGTLQTSMANRSFIPTPVFPDPPPPPMDRIEKRQPLLAESPVKEQTKQGTLPISVATKPERKDGTKLWSRIKTLFSQGDKAMSEQLLQELLNDNPEHVEGRTLLGRLCADRGEWGCAQYHCESALKINPLSIEAHYTLAQIYEHESQFDEALNEYRRVVYLERQFIPGILGMANVWRQMGRIEEARRNYRNALKQLANLSPATPVPGAEGATASELAAFATRQLQNLG